MLNSHSHLKLVFKMYKSIEEISGNAAIVWQNWVLHKVSQPIHTLIPMKS